jgi:hypothetical protein
VSKTIAVFPRIFTLQSSLKKMSTFPEKLNFPPNFPAHTKTGSPAGGGGRGVGSLLTAVAVSAAQVGVIAAAAAATRV